MCVTLSCPLSRNLLSCVPTEVRLYPSRHSQSISGGGGSQVDAHAQRAWVPPAVGWLWPCGPQQLVLGGREGASLSPPLFVWLSSSCTACSISCQRGGGEVVRWQQWWQHLLCHHQLGGRSEDRQVVAISVCWGSDCGFYWYSSDTENPHSSRKEADDWLASKWRQPPYQLLALELLGQIPSSSILEQIGTAGLQWCSKVWKSCCSGRFVLQAGPAASSVLLIPPRDPRLLPASVHFPACWTPGPGQSAPLAAFACLHKEKAADDTRQVREVCVPVDGGWVWGVFCTLVLSAVEASRAVIVLSGSAANWSNGTPPHCFEMSLPLPLPPSVLS